MSGIKGMIRNRIEAGVTMFFGPQNQRYLRKLAEIKTLMNMLLFNSILLSQMPKRIVSYGYLLHVNITISSRQDNL